MPPSLSRIFAPTERVPTSLVGHVAVEFAPNAPKPLPQSNAYVKPAAASAADGSCALVSASVNESPAKDEAGAANVAVGAAFVTATVAVSVALRPLPSVTCTRTVCVDGPSSAPAENDGVLPAVSYVPLSSRSHAYVSVPPSGSLPVAPTGTLPPSPAVYGPPADTVGGRLSVTCTTDGSWSDA